MSVLQATNAGVRRPGYKATRIVLNAVCRMRPLAMLLSVIHFQSQINDLEAQSDQHKRQVMLWQLHVVLDTLGVPPRYPSFI